VVQIHQTDDLRKLARSVEHLLEFRYLREQMDKGELKPTFSDLLPVSVALEKAERQATRASEGQEPQPERRVVTQQDYDDTLAAAKARMAELKKKEGA